MCCAVNEGYNFLSDICCRDNYAACMQAEQPQGLTPPADLRPAQLGIVLVGRVILGHASATLVDLAQRGFLRIDEAAGTAGPDWLLTDLRDQVADHSALLRFEATLLNGLFARQPVVLLSETGHGLITVLDRFRAQLSRDAVRHGWLRRWPRGNRSPRGEQLLKQIHNLRWQLRTLTAAGDSGALAGLAPYAMIFGLGAPSPASLDGADGTGTAQRRGTAAQWPQSDRFATSWLAACAGLASSPGHGHRSSAAGSGDFVHNWSAPHDHDHGHGHGGHGHDPGHGGYGGGHEHHGGEHHGGGHAGGFDGGHSGY
jgi:hypothetical protein